MATGVVHSQAPHINTPPPTVLHGGCAEWHFLLAQSQPALVRTGTPVRDAAIPCTSIPPQSNTPPQTHTSLHPTLGNTAGFVACPSIFGSWHACVSLPVRMGPLQLHHWLFPPQSITKAHGIPHPTHHLCMVFRRLPHQRRSRGAWVYTTTTLSV